jgi:hypothetical protein
MLSAAPQRAYGLRVSIESPERYRNVPYGIEVDFGKLLADQGATGTFDRFSVMVKKADRATGKLEDVNWNLSDAFLIGNAGRVNWLIDDTNEREYVIFYDVKEHGPWPPPAYVGLVGNGDCLHYNDGKPHPMHVGMSANAVAVDWDGDGVTDIISPQDYTFTRESPDFCVRFFRNEGTNDAPLFGDGIPLQARSAEGVSFVPGGLSIEVLDWDGDGLPDILSIPYGGGDITLFANTGERDAHALPILEAKGGIGVASAGKYPCIRVVDWHGDGRRSLLVGWMIETEGVTIDQPLWFAATEEEKQNAYWPRWYYKCHFDYYENLARPGEPPKFAPPVRLKTTDGQDISWYIAPSFESMDYDGDGQEELLVLCNSERMDKGYTRVRVYKNVGTPSAPVFEDRGLLPGLKDRSFLYFRQVDTPAFKGLLVQPGSGGGKVQYLELKGRNAKGQPLYRSRGFLMQRSAYVNSYSGFAQACLSDWEGDGDLDLTMGCETGWVTRCRNVGSQKWPVFTPSEFLSQGGRPIELLNGPWSDPGSLMEAPIGQTAPMYVDWDGDGTMDLLVAIARKLLFYRNVGTSLHPKLLAPVDIAAVGQQRVKGHRDKPAIIDWDGDGLLDIVGAYEGMMYLFKRYRDRQTGELRLAAGMPLRNQDGTNLSPQGGFWNAGDWKGKGSYDLFFAGWNSVVYVENAGTNAEPAFLLPVAMTADGESISVGKHVTTPIPVDWDRSGRLDLFVSGESGLLHLFRRNYLEGAHKRITCRVARNSGDTILNFPPEPSGRASASAAHGQGRAQGAPRTPRPRAGAPSARGG